MANEPFITIGIASYNYARYLNRAFVAIRKQNFHDFELIYADDGSTDDSINVIQQIIQDNPDMTIRLIQGENLGVMGNKQRILDHARGKYVMLCDADDWMEENCLETLAQAAKETDADRVVSEIRNVDENGVLLHVQSYPKSPSRWNMVLHHGVLYKMALIRKYNIRLGTRVPDDFCFVESFNIYAKNTIFLRKGVYNWCIREESTSNSKTNGNIWKGEKILRGVTEQAAELMPYIEDRTDRMLLQAEVIKYYYYHTLKALAETASYKDAQTLYSSMKKMMNEYAPDYLKNPYYRIGADAPFRKPIQLFLCCFTFAEIIHCGGAMIALLYWITRFAKLDL